MGGVGGGSERGAESVVGGGEVSEGCGERGMR